MMSEIAKKILESTPAEVKERVRDYSDIVATELTEEEWRVAIFEAKLKKWFHEKNRPYWEKVERAFEDDKGENK